MTVEPLARRPTMVCRAEEVTLPRTPSDEAPLGRGFAFQGSRVVGRLEGRNPGPRRVCRRS